MIDNLQLQMSNEIELDSIGSIHIPLVKDIVKLTEGRYNLFIYPFTLSFDIINEDDMKFIDEYNKKNEIQLSFFKLFFLQNENCFFIDKYLPENLKVLNISMLEILVNSLQFFFKGKLHNIIENEIVLENDNKELISINSSNYDLISEIILKVSNATKQKKKEVPKFENDRQRDVYQKIMAGRQRKQAEDNLDMADIINIVIHGGKSFIPYREINKMTIPQLYNTFNSIIELDGFDRDYGKYLAGSDPKDLNLDPYWIQKIKFNKRQIQKQRY